MGPPGHPACRSAQPPAAPRKPAALTRRHPSGSSPSENPRFGGSIPPCATTDLPALIGHSRPRCRFGGHRAGRHTDPSADASASAKPPASDGMKCPYVSSSTFALAHPPRLWTYLRLVCRPSKWSRPEERFPEAGGSVLRCAAPPSGSSCEPGGEMVEATNHPEAHEIPIGSLLASATDGVLRRDTRHGFSRLRVHLIRFGARVLSLNVRRNSRGKYRRISSTPTSRRSNMTNQSPDTTRIPVLEEIVDEALLEAISGGKDAGSRFSGASDPGKGKRPNG